MNKPSVVSNAQVLARATDNPGQRVLILGAAGRDFHTFNIYFRDNPQYLVIAFTATQIPNIEGRHYPPELAGPRYPQGIPIVRESELADLIQAQDIDLAVFAYSDVSYEQVMHIGAQALAAGQTIDTFIMAVYNYPTLSDAYKYAAYDGLGQWQQWQAQAKSTQKN